MKLTQEELAKAVRAFQDALPAGVTSRMMVTNPRIGIFDGDAGQVYTFLFAENAEDLMRFEQAYQRGLSALETEQGLEEAVFRHMDHRTGGKSRTMELFLGSRMEASQEEKSPD